MSKKVRCCLLKMSEIENAMKRLYKKDPSDYSILWVSLHTLNNLHLINGDMYNQIVELDHKLFTEVKNDTGTASDPE